MPLFCLKGTQIEEAEELSDPIDRQNLPSVVEEEQNTLDHIIDHLQHFRQKSTGAGNYDEELEIGRAHV